MITATTIQNAIVNKGVARQAIYQNFLGYMLTVVRRYGIAESDEADVIQDIFVEAFVSLSNYDSQKGEFTPWLRQLAVNQILKRKRKSKKMSIVELKTSSHEDQVDIVYEDFETGYILDEIQKLPSGYQTVFNMYEIDGYSHKEIGKALDISPQTSKSQLSRAKGILKKKLSRYLAIL